MGHASPYSVIITSLAAWALGSGVLAQTPRLVRDLEDQREVRPAYLGQAWQTPSGVVVAADGRLWTLPNPPLAPVRLLDRVDASSPLRLEVWPLPDGRLIASGAHPTDGETGLWLVEASGISLLAAPPAALAHPNLVSAPLAAHGGVIVANLATGPDAQPGLYRLGPGLTPQLLGPPGWTHGGEYPGAWCADIAPARFGFVGCARDPAGVVWGTDGQSPRSLLWGEPNAQAFDWLTPIDGIVFGRYRGTPGSPTAGGTVLRSNGTAAGTWLIADAGVPVGDFVTETFGPVFGPLFSAYQGGVVWLDGSAVPTKIKWVARDGQTASVLGSGPFHRLLAIVGTTFYLAGGDSGDLWAFDEDGARPVVELGPSAALRFFSPLGHDLMAFSVWSQEHGVEVWVTDGTTAGTRMVDWRPGPAWGLYDPSGLAAVDDGALVALVDQDQVPRPTLLDHAGTLQPLDHLVVPGNAGSHPWGLKQVGARVAFMADTRRHGRSPWVSDGSPATTVPIGDGSWTECGSGGFLLLEPDWIAECPGDDSQARVYELTDGSPIEVGALTLEPLLGGQTLEGARLDSTRVVISHPFSPVRRHDVTTGASSPVTDDTCLDSEVQRVLGRVEAGVLFTGCRGGIPGLFLDDGVGIVGLAPHLWSDARPVGDVVIVSRGLSDGIETLVTDGTAAGTALLPVPLRFAANPQTARTKTCAVSYDFAPVAEVLAFYTETRSTTSIGTVTGPASLIEGPEATWILSDLDADGYHSLHLCDAGHGTLTPVATAPLRGTIGTTRGTLWLIDQPAGPASASLVRVDADTGARHVVHRAEDVVAAWGEFRGVVVGERVFVTIADQAHGRELWAVDAVGPLIFADGFESGDTTGWSP